MDAAIRSVLASLLGEGETFTVLELKINCMRPVWHGKLRAWGRVARAGQVIGLEKCDVVDEHERLVARAHYANWPLGSEMAAGR